MKLTLTITASAAALANILSLIESDDGEDTVKLVHSGTFPAPDMPALPVFPSTSPMMPEVTAVAPTVPAAAGAPEFDSTGLAWDERIHSKQKGQTNDGKWRKQRNVDDAFYNAVEAELRALHGGMGNAPTMQPAMVMPSIEPVATVHGAVAVEPVASEPVMMQQPVAPQPVAIPMPVAVAPQPVAVPVPMPVAVAAPVPIAEVSQPIAEVSQPIAEVSQPIANESVTFHTVMTHVGTAMGAGTMTPDYLVGLVTEINQQCGLAMQSFTDMAAFPNAVSYCWAAFARDGKL